MKTFNDFSDAFDYCREKDQPVTVLVQGEKWKLYPSGYAVEIATEATLPRSGRS